jgi:phage terminase large subunit
MYFDGVVLDETGQIRPSAWYSVLRPALSDRKGWAIFAGTPAGKNFFWQIKEEARLNPETHLL